MDRKEAIKIITAYAACASAADCDVCPLYQEEKKRTKRGLCVAEITQERTREALQLLARTENYTEV